MHVFRVLFHIPDKCLRNGWMEGWMDTTFRQYGRKDKTFPYFVFSYHAYSNMEKSLDFKPLQTFLDRTRKFTLLFLLLKSFFFFFE